MRIATIATVIISSMSVNPRCWTLRMPAPVVVAMDRSWTITQARPAASSGPTTGRRAAPNGSHCGGIPHECRRIGRDGEPPRIHGTGAGAGAPGRGRVRSEPARGLRHRLRRRPRSPRRRPHPGCRPGARGDHGAARRRGAKAGRSRARPPMSRWSPARTTAAPARAAMRWPRPASAGWSPRWRTPTRWSPARGSRDCAPRACGSRWALARSVRANSISAFSAAWCAERPGCA